MQWKMLFANGLICQKNEHKNEEEFLLNFINKTVQQQNSPKLVQKKYKTDSAEYNCYRKYWYLFL